MQTKVSESQIQSTLIDYLQRKKHLVIRLNNIPVSQMVSGQRVFRKMPKGSINGMADLLVITDGGFGVWLEVKAPKGKQSPDQKEFQRRVEEKGGEYYLVRRLEDIINIGL
jgi:hypothetical protein